MSGKLAYRETDSLEMSKLHFVLDDTVAEAMARHVGVYDRMMELRRVSKLECGQVEQRVTSPFCVTDFTYWFGRTKPSDNGWTVAFAFVPDFGSIEQCEKALNEIGKKIHQPDLN